ncbi:AlpA family phage regulatory protein [Qipengyuania sp. DY56-A-20]|jgi:prophage regulatory protein|uniref:AlpA family phage regulatory protein n=1 Tax=Qipengyuania benthica TaxID=3067651 RepID=A0ABT9HA17_9SPHN|nr:AlpA family phage regulatory protein [Qipengyuania sp. DY56-A-20]MDP4540148.1 AlpA family phage regulatory protein [Qipengyuania sp. DY56-A-20]
MTDTPRSLLRLSDVIRRVSFSRATIYNKIAAGEFPRPVPISENRVAWDSAAIDAWIADKLGEAA